MSSLEQLIQIALLGILQGGVYALMAAGLTLVFGVMRIVNLAHVALVILGAYLSWYAFTLLGIDPFMTTVANVPVLFGLGYALYWLLVRRILGRPRYVPLSVLLMFALALILEGIMGFAFSGFPRVARPSYATAALRFAGLYAPSAFVYGFALSVALLGTLFAFLQYTRTGRAIRATMQDRKAAQVVGIDVDRVSAVAFGIGVGLAGGAGAAMSVLFTFAPQLQWQWIALVLSVVVLGGMGSLPGVIVGAVLLAVAAAFVGNLIGPEWSPMIFYLSLFLIMLMRPQGLLGKRGEL